MSFLLFAPDDVKALRERVVPDETQPIFGYAERCAILRAASDLSRETYVWTFGALGQGPECFPLWKRDQELVPIDEHPAFAPYMGARS